MLERELKLHVPAASAAAIENELRRAGATHIALRARYFDTQDKDLARAGVALRVRLEGGQWVQTAKGPGPDELTRIEINHPRARPELDISLYTGTVLEPLFLRLGKPLMARYETCIDRLVLRQAGSCGVVELALDQGTIRAGQLELPVCELELEQIDGDTDHLFTLGQRWLTRHSLILDFRSKAERGSLLGDLAPANQSASGPDQPPRQANSDFRPLFAPQHARPVTLKAGMSLRQAYLQCANECLNQIVRNAALLATMQNPGADVDLRIEYVHQLRVGIRRLRSCWTLFSKWMNIDLTEFGAQLRPYFTLLGHVRNNDVIHSTPVPGLSEAGMPELAQMAIASAGAPGAQDALALAASAPFQSTLLELLKHLVQQAESSPENTLAYPPGVAATAPVDGVMLGQALSKRLNKWLRRLCRDGRMFDQLSIDARHDLRKQVKRVRYGLEFSQGVLQQKKLIRVRAALSGIQKILGDLNDLYVAQDYYQALAADQPQAFFALGWLKAMQTQKQALAKKAFARLERAGRVKPVKPTARA
ncbi:MAG: CYTH and CHAD domain-containing protein [Pusillimonas sp.]